MTEFRRRDSAPAMPRAASRRGPSMSDVAKLAGVSSQTVSRVSNGHSNVDSQTRERVVAAMRELDYRPNGAARALKRGSYNSIGVIVFALSSVGNLRTLHAVSAAASDAGYAVNLIPVAHPTPEEVSVAFSSLGEHAVDGIIVIIESHLLRSAEFEVPLGIPVVIMDSIARDDLPIVDNDQFLGARQATEHLLSLGHKNVWHIAGPAKSISSVQREASWREVLTEAGIAPPEVLYGDWSADSGYTHGLTLAKMPEVTAVFAGNDQMALGVMRAMHENNRPVPQNVSIVGFDDIDEAGNFWPPLTTVRQDFTEAGIRGVAALISAIHHEKFDHRPPSVPTTFIVRGSTAPPPA